MDVVRRGFVHYVCVLLGKQRYYYQQERKYPGDEPADTEHQRGGVADKEESLDVALNAACLYFAVGDDEHARRKKRQEQEFDYRGYRYAPGGSAFDQFYEIFDRKAHEPYQHDERDKGKSVCEDHTCRIAVDHAFDDARMVSAVGAGSREYVDYGDKHAYAAVCRFLGAQARDVRVYDG